MVKLAMTNVEHASPPLKGLVVLDLSKVLAGPLCTQYLADLGADVVKVETPSAGDETRHWPPIRNGLGTVFLSANRNKRSIAVDLKQPAGQAIVHELAAGADVVIESFGTGVVDRLGCDAQTLRHINPRLIYCSISGFGRDGPLRRAPGYDVILQAFSGMMALTGVEGGDYLRSPISPIDQGTGLHALIGIQSALLRRNVTGEGALVEVSLFDTSLAFLAYNAQSYWERGVPPARCGSSHESLVPYQAFEAADGPVMIGVANDGLWLKFCAVAGLEPEPRFGTNGARAEHRAEIVTLVQSAIAKQPVAFWWRELLAAGVPCSPINSLPDALEHPHTATTGMVLDYEHPAAGPLKAMAQPIRIDGGRAGVRRPPPMLGEHTEEVLHGLGYDADRIASLRLASVIR